MKKIIAFLLVVVMIMSLAACGKKNGGNNSGNDASGANKENADDASDDKKDAGANTSDDKQDAGENTSDDKQDEEAENTSTARGPEYWSEFYGQNRCPFSIMCGAVEKKYYFRNGGKPAFWVYTSDNTDGWYIYNNHVISADNAFAIDLEYLEGEYFSSFCSFDAQPYSGDSLSKEQQKEQLNGVFYVLNPYTPVATNWGIRFFSEGSGLSLDDVPDATVYGLTDTLRDQEWFDMYVSWNPNDYPEFDGDALDLWAFPHRDKSEYKEILTDDLKDQSANIGCFEYEEEADLAHIRTFIPNKAGDGLEPGRVDLLITYAGDVVVGLVSVDVLGE